MKRVDYDWGNVPLGGGGYVTGIITHPKDKNVKYIRTDVGGAYRWNPDNMEWVPITEYIEGKEGWLYGIDGFAINPDNTDEIYLCQGDSGRPSDVFKSSDRGETWERLGLNQCFLGNGNVRQSGECIMLDPNDTKIIYVGTRWAGLWVSRDGGKTWQNRAEVTHGEGNGGTRVVIVDPNETVNGRSKTVYASVHGDGLWVSHDGGETFAKIENSPAHISRAALFNDGRLAIAAATGLFIYDGKEFKDISPMPEKRYGGVDVNKLDNNRIICSLNINQGMSCMNLPIYYSDDCGETWRYMNDVDICKKHYSIPWWPGYYFSSDTSDIKFEVGSLTEVWFSDWYGVWVTKDITADVVDWHSYIKGHEEIVAFTMISPPEGDARFLVGVADNDGMRYEDIHEYPPARRGISTNGMDFCETDCNFMAAVGGIHNGAVGEAGYSTDNGKTWIKMVGWDDNEIGLRLAVNPVDPKNMCALIINGTPRFTTDGGRYWHYSKGTPKDLITSYWGAYGHIVCDRVADGVFYAMTRYGLFRSVDRGAHFEPISEEWKTGLVRPLPYHKGGLWYGDGTGLYISEDFGDTFKKLDTVESVNSFDFGKGLKDGECALYVFGVIDGVLSKYRSDDYGKTFVDIGDGIARGKAGGLIADRKVYGRIYMSTGGRGFYYAEPKK